jgi:phage tail protein X
MATFQAAAQQNEPLDALVWRVLGAGSGTVEQVLELNRDIAGAALSAASVLSEGQIVTLPLITAAPVKERKMVQLWD